MRPPYFRQLSRRLPDAAEFFGVPATGRAIAWEGAVIRSIEGGLAVEEWNAPDIAGIMAQLTAP